MTVAPRHLSRPPADRDYVLFRVVDVGEEGDHADAGGLPRIVMGPDQVARFSNRKVSMSPRQAQRAKRGQWGFTFEIRREVDAGGSTKARVTPLRLRRIDKVYAVEPPGIRRYPWPRALSVQ